MSGAGRELPRHIAAGAAASPLDRTKGGRKDPAAKVTLKVTKPIGVKARLTPRRKITFSSSLSLSFLSSLPWCSSFVEDSNAYQ
jgi:hypothetical protein